MNILHLTDLHFGQPSPLAHWKATISEFFTDLKHLVGTAGPIDYVIVSGDVAYSGDKGQYARATEFFDQLHSFLSNVNPSVAILPIPGNHDVARPSPTDPVVHLIKRDPKFVVDQIEQALRSGDKNDLYHQTTETAFAAFVEWAKTLGWRVTDWEYGAMPGDAVVHLEGSSFSIGVIALNTALLHLSDDAKEGSLALFNRQVDTVLELEEKREAPTTYLFVVHHPLAWLDSKSTSILEDGLFAALPVSVVLFGHRHVSEFTTLARGADPNQIHLLQGKSFFGLEHLADGTTKRLHGYSVLRIEKRDEQLELQVAPRAAQPRPAGGYTFACERSRAWYVPKDSDWTQPLKLRTTSAPEQLGTNPGMATPKSKLEVQEVDASTTSEFQRAIFDHLREQLFVSIDPATSSYWRRIPDTIEFLQNATTVCSLAGNEVTPTLPELLYVWSIVLLSAAHVEIGHHEFRTLVALEADPNWSRDVVGTLTPYDRLVERAKDLSAAPEIRATLDEWLLRRVLDRSAAAWHLQGVRELARRIASVLERRSSHVESLAERLLTDAQFVADRSIPTRKIQENWAYAYHNERKLDQLRGSLTFSLAMTLHTLTFDLTRSGKEIVEQIGIVSNFDLAKVHLDLSEMRWVATPTGDADLIARCSDPAVEAAFQQYVDEIHSLSSYLPTNPEGNALRDRFISRLKTQSITPQQNRGVSIYDRPITRLVMDPEKIRSLLMGEQLYGQARLAIRELYQNALDACRYRDLRYMYFKTTGHWPRANWAGRIEFIAAYDEKGAVTALECRDNGIGMSRATLRDCFLNAGAKFVETASFAEEQAEWLRVDPSLRLYPNSTFGIGVYSYFMLADVVEVITRSESADGTLSGSLRLQMNAGSSVVRLAEFPAGDDDLPTGGTLVRLYLRPEFRSTSKLQLGNFIDEVVLRSPYELSLIEGSERQTRHAGEISPDIPSPHYEAWASGESAGWWTVGRGTLLADGIRTPEHIVGLMANLHGPQKPVLRVDRNAVVKWDLKWVLEQTTASAQALAEWPRLSLAWLWDFCERYPVPGHELFENLIRIREKVPLGQSRLWSQTADLAFVGCFPGDRYLIPGLHDSRWETEYPEIEIPKLTKRTGNLYSQTVRFPSCLRPWRRRVWMESVPELFAGWDPDARDLLWSPIETVAANEHLTFPVWEPERLVSLNNPDSIDAALIASQPDITAVSLSSFLDTGHSTFTDVVALLHGATRCNIGLGEALHRVLQFVRFGLRGLPNIRPDSFDYTPTSRDCKLVASIGRAWSASKRIIRSDFLQLLPLCQEEGLTVGEAVSGLQELLDRLGITYEAPKTDPLWANHVPSTREVRFFGFGEYDHGRELRYGRGTRGALMRGAQRADMQRPEVEKLIRRYRSFGMGRYEKALRALRLNPSDKELLRAWSTNFDSRAPWVDEDVFRRGFISDQPSSVEELLGHAVFYSVLSGISLREAATRVFMFPGLSSAQRTELADIPDSPADEQDLEILRSRIGRMSSYSDKRFAGIGQQELVLRRWSPLELKAAATATKISMEDVFARLRKFTFLGVRLPECTPEEVDSYEFTDLDMTLLTTEDRSMGAFGRFSHDKGDKKPIIGPIPALHLMFVAADEKISLGEVVSSLRKLEHLGVESGARSLPAHLQSYVPSREEVALAGRLMRSPLGYGIVKEAFQSRRSIELICNSIAPWASWILNPSGVQTVQQALELIINGSGSIVPSYSQVSFYAAARAQAMHNNGILDRKILVILAAQAGATINEALANAVILQSVFEADLIELHPGENLGAAGDERPDSRWIAVIAPEAFVPRSSKTLRSFLGLDTQFARRVAEIVGNIKVVGSVVRSPRTGKDGRIEDGVA
jgi:hypothetical protein